jgi:hypothetical protein
MACPGGHCAEGETGALEGELAAGGSCSARGRGDDDEEEAPGRSSGHTKAGALGDGGSCVRIAVHGCCITRGPHCCIVARPWTISPQTPWPLGGGSLGQANDGRNARPFPETYQPHTPGSLPSTATLHPTLTSLLLVSLVALLHPSAVLCLSSLAAPAPAPHAHAHIS